MRTELQLKLISMVTQSFEFRPEEKIEVIKELVGGTTEQVVETKPAEKEEVEKVEVEKEVSDTELSPEAQSELIKLLHSKEYEDKTAEERLREYGIIGKLVRAAQLITDEDYNKLLDYEADKMSGKKVERPQVNMAKLYEKTNPSNILKECEKIINKDSDIKENVDKIVKSNSNKRNRKERIKMLKEQELEDFNKEMDNKKPTEVRWAS